MACTRNVRDTCRNLFVFEQNWERHDYGIGHLLKGKQGSQSKMGMGKVSIELHLLWLGEARGRGWLLEWPWASRCFVQGVCVAQTEQEFLAVDGANRLPSRDGVIEGLKAEAWQSHIWVRGGTVRRARGCCTWLPWCCKKRRKLLGSGGWVRGYPDPFLERGLHLPHRSIPFFGTVMPEFREALWFEELPHTLHEAKIFKRKKYDFAHGFAHAQKNGGNPVGKSVTMYNKQLRTSVPLVAAGVKVSRKVHW